MALIDWLVLVFVLLAVIVYGIWKSRGQQNMDSYFLGNQQMPWYVVLLSVMGTQASAITFLSAPGQAYTDGMRFVQYYFGLPLAMVVLCITFVPIFRKFQVFTAYQFLEQRFDVKTRTLTSGLFLVSRGLSTGISILAPTIILSAVFGWNLYLTNILMGGLLIIYTVFGGTKAVAYTQTQQFIVIFAGMFIAGYLVVNGLPETVSFSDALHISGKSDKLNVFTTGFTKQGFDWKDRYNIWSGGIGGFFLALSYFGTDQSQVGRYVSAKSVSESRIGLLMNGLVKVPMQFLILLIGALLFSFFQFEKPPLFFKQSLNEDLARLPEGKKLLSEYKNLTQTERQLTENLLIKQKEASDIEVSAIQTALANLENDKKEMRKSASELLKTANPATDTNDTNYIFLYFVVNYLPKGLVGLLIAVIFLSSWGSIAAALNSLASTSMVDIHCRFFQKNLTDSQQLSISRAWTLGWGIFCIMVAQLASNMGSLIEAVNILGSLFYGTILGIFLVAFYLKKIGGTATFWAAVLSELLVITVYQMEIVSFLWLNVIGCMLVILLAFILHYYSLWKHESNI
ncbi:MAG: sodium:solute symporter [Verrucomicrobia bacterium]|nr:sodium:solute symporter [Cytophagales bacterium]